MLKNQFHFYDPIFITPSYNRKQFYQHRHFYILHTRFACAIHFLANIFFFTCRNCFSFRNPYLYYLCENITLIYKSELYSSAQFLLFSLSKIRFEMQMRRWWLTSYSYLIRRSLYLHFLEAKIRTRAVKYSCCVKNLCLFWSLQEIILSLVIPY